MRLRKKHFAIPEMRKNPYVFFNGEENKGKWKEIFGNDNPIYLEIGAGKGKFTIESAKRNKNINYIMVDIETNALIYATRKILEEDLTNVRAMPINAENILDYFDKDEINRIYINFCNPWPKSKHKKRRLTYPRLLEKYKVILKPKSQIFFKTDDLELFEESLDYFIDEGFSILIYDFDMKLEDYPENIVTEYENKFRKLGEEIKFGVFEYYVN
ncbi:MULTISPECIES: tRNA (guanosine(46)-N7)-methyltransferase TrmB [Peptoniphilus]|uniref:tRNA (guanosine(46)-N7)-methyltransferase TrmB n=1 Tax=Peptoniphilus TaxID=162289 RepID=UPI00028914E2|nr:MULTISPECIES: tRNA (guanosine(46)-N7)-methyltransferase TrmB [Peptoniphilus]MBS6611153.1 tRNA (guanosine(46)-N7)-methyltransferase TrmB [Peptoniphilus harei]MDU1044103.1 tRNA (guanosine(46)-N7)-methyltransferase TrmB [Peptoniphilus rhinitidis]MDU1955051.1 tRNA (guanosine(46)-N7)-methyltransferase TrmB [Peptoniphilus lacydonensis]MDU2109841.1 tRNA (guanosine(46)-N7)-methyltransferase TrmB [Peptoniphilus lacydonensis]MDU2115970.1 tRNA (guanosine(46)-N7)-methyltransferase TrmB [Peptoniphilus l